MYKETKRRNVILIITSVVSSFLLGCGYTIIFLLGCGYTITKTPNTPKTVTFTIESKTGNLNYNCNDFRPQAKTTEDITAIYSEVRKILGSDNVVLKLEILPLLDNQNIPKLEQIVVSVECKKLLNK